MSKLYTYFRSSASYRVRIALALKGLEFDAVFVHLASGQQMNADYLALNPQGLTPSFETDDGEVLTQSLAILEYLDETHPEPPLLPADATGRARVRAMAQVVASEIHPINNLRVLKYLKDPLAQDQAAIDNWYGHWVAVGFAALEAMVSKFGAEGGYCYGDAVSLADLCLAPQMWNARRFERDLAPYPRLVDIDARLNEIEAFTAATPENQPDFVQ
jgi:maleylacetoacetate isomerase/maleylpyruvate isomerase